MKNIATALVKAQKAFAPLLKTSTNPAFARGGKTGKYADLASCVDAVMDSLNSNGIALVQHLSECADGVIVETVFIHESGEVLTCGKLHVPAAKQDPQGYGSALTYARRYSLMAACGIAPEDDDGNAASRPKSNVDESAMLDHIDAIKSSVDMDHLKKVYTTAYAACQGDQQWQAKMIAAKDATKKAIEAKA